MYAFLETSDSDEMRIRKASIRKIKKSINREDEYEPMDDPSLIRRERSNLINKNAMDRRGRGTIKIREHPTSHVP